MTGWRKAFYSLFIFCSLLGIIEWYLYASWRPQLTDDALKVGMQLRPDPDLIWSLEPGEATQFGVRISVNDDGMRAGAVSNANTRWLILGDSSFFGHGLSHEDTIHVGLKKEMAHVGHDIDVLVGAAPGHSLLQSRRWLDRQGWDLEPDLLIIGNLWSDNHFADFQDHKWMKTLDSPLYRSQFHLGRLRSFQWLAQRLRPLETEGGFDQNRRVSWVREPYSDGKKRRVPLNKYAEELDGLLADAEEKGVGALVVQPANVFRLRGDVPKPTWGPYFKAQKLVSEYRGAPLIDMALAMKTEGLTPETAFLDEMHPSALGARVTAKHIVSTVVGMGWPKVHLIPKTNHPYRSLLQDPWKGGPPGEL